MPKSYTFKSEVGNIGNDDSYDNAEISDKVLDDLLKANFGANYGSPFYSHIKEALKDYSHRVFGIESTYGKNLESKTSTAKGGFQFLVGEDPGQEGNVSSLDSARTRGTLFWVNSGYKGKTVALDGNAYHFLHKDKIGKSGGGMTLDEQRALFYLNTFEHFSENEIGLDSEGNEIITRGGPLSNKHGLNAIKMLAFGTQEEKNNAKKWLFWNAHYKPDPDEFGTETVKIGDLSYTMPKNSKETTDAKHIKTLERMDEFFNHKLGTFHKPWL